MTLYTSIFKQSWAITRRNPALWVFGFFVLFFGGKGIDFELFFSNSQLIRSTFSPFRPQFWATDGWKVLVHELPFSTSSIALLGALVVAAALIAVAIMIISHIGLVDAFSKPDAERRRYTLDDAIKKSKSHFWSVLGVNIVGKALIYGLVALASSPLFVSQLSGLRYLYTFLLLLLVTPLTIVISMLTKYAVNSIVLENTTVGESIVRAITLFGQNVGISIELAFFMFIAYFAVNLLAVLVAVVVTLPLLVLGFAIGYSSASLMGILFYAVLLYVVIALLLIATTILFSPWHFGNWTLLFQELTKGSRRSKIHRVFRGE